jgi:hypothetical protein
MKERERGRDIERKKVWGERDERKRERGRDIERNREGER